MQLFSAVSRSVGRERPIWRATHLFSAVSQSVGQENRTEPAARCQLLGTRAPPLRYHVNPLRSGKPPPALHGGECESCFGPPATTPCLRLLGTCVCRMSRECCLLERMCLFDRDMLVWWRRACQRNRNEWIGLPSLYDDNSQCLSVSIDLQF